MDENNLMCPEQRQLLIFNYRHLDATAPVNRLFIQLNVSLRIRRQVLCQTTVLEYLWRGHGDQRHAADGFILRLGSTVMRRFADMD